MQPDFPRSLLRASMGGSNLREDQQIQQLCREIDEIFCHSRYSCSCRAGAVFGKLFAYPRKLPFEVVLRYLSLLGSSYNGEFLTNELKTKLFHSIIILIFKQHDRENADNMMQRLCCLFYMDDSWESSSWKAGHLLASGAEDLDTSLGYLELASWGASYAAGKGQEYARTSFRQHMFLEAIRSKLPFSSFIFALHKVSHLSADEIETLLALLAKDDAGLENIREFEAVFAGSLSELQKKTFVLILVSKLLKLPKILCTDLIYYCTLKGKILHFEDPIFKGLFSKEIIWDCSDFSKINLEVDPFYFPLDWYQSGPSLERFEIFLFLAQCASLSPENIRRKLNHFASFPKELIFTAMGHLLQTRPAAEKDEWLQVSWDYFGINRKWYQAAKQWICLPGRHLFEAFDLACSLITQSEHPHVALGLRALLALEVSAEQTNPDNAIKIFQKGFEKPLPFTIHLKHPEIEMLLQLMGKRLKFRYKLMIFDLAAKNCNMTYDISTKMSRLLLIEILHQKCMTINEYILCLEALVNPLACIDKAAIKELGLLNSFFNIRPVWQNEGTQEFIEWEFKRLESLYIGCLCAYKMHLDEYLPQFYEYWFSKGISRIEAIVKNSLAVPVEDRLSLRDEKNSLCQWLESLFFRLQPWPRTQACAYLASTVVKNLVINPGDPLEKTLLLSLKEDG